MSSPRPSSLNIFSRSSGDKSPRNSPSSPVNNGPPDLRKSIRVKDITYMSVPPPRITSETTNSPPVRSHSSIGTVCPVSSSSNSANMEVTESRATPEEENTPEGYEARKCFVNTYNGEVWFPAWDSTGQVYYYQVSKGLSSKYVWGTFILCRKAGSLIGRYQMLKDQVRSRKPRLT